MKNRTLIGAVCIILAVFLTFGGTFIINRVQTKTVTVVAADSGIKKGEAISSAKLKKVVINEGSVLSNQWKFKNEKDADNLIEQLNGTYATVDICSGDFLSKEKVTNNSTNIDAALEGLTGKKVAMTVPVNGIGSHLAGKLQAGDVVSIMITDPKKKETNIPLAFQYLKVITLTTGGGVDSDHVKKNDDGSFTMPTTITFILYPLQAQMLRAELASGKQLYLTLVFRGTDDKAEKFVAETDKYMDTLEEAAMKMAEQRAKQALINTNNADFNAYYAAHKEEFISILDDIFNDIFNQHVFTDVDEASAYSDVVLDDDETVEIEEEVVN